MDQLQVQTGNERLKRLMLSLAKPEKWKATEELAAASPLDGKSTGGAARPQPAGICSG